MDFNSFQGQCRDWIIAAFGEQIANDKIELNHRFLEESLELVQSLGCSKAEVLQLVEYVYSRFPGEPSQEVGGVATTLASLCSANKLVLDWCALKELARVWEKIEAIRAKKAARVWQKIEAIRAKQAGKPKGSALPQ